MPRVARFSIASIADLSRQLRYAPQETRAKQMNAAEAFASDVQADQLYPEDFIIYRITGYRPRIENPALLVGEALLGDLANLVQHLSDGLDLPPDYSGRSAITFEEVARRLNIVTKTIQRYRRRGLICHYIRFGDDDRRLACFEDALQRFIDSHQMQIARAGNFSRIESATVREFIQEARALRQSRQFSLNEAALFIARKNCRAHETIRMILRKHERESSDPIFSERGPLSERDGQIIHRAARWGVPIEVLAERFGRTPPTLHRAINRHRSRLLTDLRLSFIDLPTFRREDAAAVILGGTQVRNGLDQLLPQHDVLSLLGAAKEATFESEAAIAFLAAYNYLKRRAVLAMNEFGTWPGSIELDGVETDLRWASKIKRRLVSLGMPVVIGRIEQHFHRALSALPSDQIIRAISTGTKIASDVIETIDPSRSQQYSRVLAYAADRALSQEHRISSMPGRASARHAAGSIMIADLFSDLVQWDSFLEMRADLRSHIDTFRNDRLRALIVKRYGCNGAAPQSITAIAAQSRTAPATISRLINRAEMELRQHVRRIRRQ